MKLTSYESGLLSCFERIFQEKSFRIPNHEARFFFANKNFIAIFPLFRRIKSYSLIFDFKFLKKFKNLKECYRSLNCKINTMFKMALLFSRLYYLFFICCNCEFDDDKNTKKKKTKIKKNIHP